MASKQLSKIYIYRFSGKTTSINTIVNYFLGVELEDPFRFKLINEGDTGASSSTIEVSAYIIHAQLGARFPHSLTVIDTPGFGDTNGLDHDQKLVEKLKSFYEMGKKLDIVRIHAVGLVVQANTIRLTAEQQYIFDSVLQVFGKDVGKTFVAMLTFADEAEPLALKALNGARVPVHGSFPFNNSPIFANPEKLRFGGKGELKRLWNSCFDKIRLFCDRLKDCEAVSLAITKEVVDERVAVEDTLQRLQEEMQKGKPISCICIEKVYCLFITAWK